MRHINTYKGVKLLLVLKRSKLPNSPVSKAANCSPVPGTLNITSYNLSPSQRTLSLVEYFFLRSISVINESHISLISSTIGSSLLLRI